VIQPSTGYVELFDHFDTDEPAASDEEADGAQIILADSEQTDNQNAQLVTGLPEDTEPPSPAVETVYQSATRMVKLTGLAAIAAAHFILEMTL
jgi:hypothetical protein